MVRFQGFYTGGEIAEENTNHSETEVFAKRRQKLENSQVSKRLLNVWRTDLSKCSSISDYQSYIKKYDSPDNPYIIEAKQKIDDLCFSNCKRIEDYNAYLSSFPSGRNVVKAKLAISSLQTNANTSSGSNASSSHDSNISGEDIWGVIKEDIWGFIKKVIAVLVILPLIGILYLWIDGQVNGTTVGGYGLLIVGPVWKWAFDD